MKSPALIRRLEHTPRAIEVLVSGLTGEEAAWKPAPEHWSILEVVCHLLDEEREDFRARLRSTLEDPARPWIDLQLDGIAERRGYNQRDLKKVVAELVAERNASMAWLRSLGSIDGSGAYVHPKWGPISAGDLLASWAAHDALHLRQIARRLHGLAARDAGAHKVAYAGDW